MKNFINESDGPSCGGILGKSFAPVMSPEKRLRYSDTRLFSRKNAKPEDISAIWLMLGYMPEEVRAILGKFSLPFELVKQHNSREPIYVQNGDLQPVTDGNPEPHILTNRVLVVPCYSRFARQRRYIDMISDRQNLSGDSFEFDMIYPDWNLDLSAKVKGKPKLVEGRYDNFAYDFVQRMLVHEDKYRSTRVFRDHTIQDITDIVVCPLSAAAKEAKVVEVGESEYLSCQLLDVGGRLVLNLREMYGDQAGCLLNFILGELALDKKREHIGFYECSSVGALSSSSHFHQLFAPSGYMREWDILHGHLCYYPIDNVFAGRVNGDGANDLYLNALSVLGETVEILECARGNSCTCVGLELGETMSAINAIRDRFPKLDIPFGMLGYANDMPLQGKTLEVDLKGDQGAREGFRMIAEEIMGRR